ncbi:hypothetical protein ACYSNW_13000 [Enterococcus sp. LJL99]
MHIYTPNEIVKFVEGKVNLHEITVDDISKSFMDSLKFNAWAFTGFLADKKSFKFKLYKVEKDVNSENYFSKELTDFSPINDDDEDLLLIVDEAYGYFYTNNSYLHTEITINIIEAQRIDSNNYFEVNFLNSLKSYITQNRT